MHQIDHAVVRGGQVLLSSLPFPDGQAVRISVSELPGLASAKRSIAEVRRLLKGGVQQFDDPTEPMIPIDDWEMLK